MLHNPVAQRMQLVTALAHIRREWQDAISEKSLLEVEGNMGMLLADLINNIGLPIEDQVQVLGKELFREMQDLLKSPVHN
jgi:hypothetical protein